MEDLKFDDLSLQLDEEEIYLREIQLATETSICVDFLVIAVVFLMTIVCDRKKWRTVLYLMLGAYLILYSYLVFFSRKPYSQPILQLNIFWSYKEAFDGLTIKHLRFAREILLNIMVYIPLGLILSAIFNDYKYKLLWPVLIGLVLSVITEMIQYLTRRGITELDDVMDNGIGLLIGTGVFVLTEKLMRKKRIE